MVEPTPNDQQRALIEGIAGLYLVDAGPGTGKTFAITRRYAEIVDRPSVEPADVLLVTFTRSAATEMRDRIIDHSSYGLRELSDAPISTFHAHCRAILDEYGFDAPTHLGIDERITGSTEVIEDELIEAEFFDEFFAAFRRRHPEHVDFYRLLDDRADLIGVIKTLAAKGVAPTATGWYRTGEDHLDGDFEAFKRLFERENQPPPDSNTQSPLRSDLNEYDKDKTYVPNAPPKSEIRGPRGSKRAPESTAALAFEDDRSDLKSFVHDVYFEYLEFCLRRNYLTFGFQQLLAFVLLCEDQLVRERCRFPYVMIDEFQDTSEIQFKLALLLAETDNLCVVGDWKQSIYSFQYADVENIISFEDRLRRFRADLNRDTERVTFEVDAINRVELVENYRSTASVIDLSERALVTPATKSEDIDESILDDVTALSSNASFDNSVIRGLSHEDEHGVILSTIQEIVDYDEYAIEDTDGEARNPTLGDIAVFTRTHTFGRELIEHAEEYDIPMAYDGGIELYRTDAAKVLLAWLRIIESNADRGWAVVLEDAGYTLDEIDTILESGEYPDDMTEFRDTVRSMETVGGIARRVFDRYGFAGEHVDVLLDTIQGIYDVTTMTRGSIIRHIERGIDRGTTVNVRTSAGENSVTVQTIHAAKGLEYPIVIMANVNGRQFPSMGGTSGAIRYADPIGLRQRTTYSTAREHPHVYDDWRYDLLRMTLPREYDEERRLLYVAITRAKNHVVFTAGSNPSRFFEELPIAVETPDIDVHQEPSKRMTQSTLPFVVELPEGPIGTSPHDLMDTSVFEAMEDRPSTAVEVDFESKGIDHGAQVHEFAEAYIHDRERQPSNDDERSIQTLIDSLSGELSAERSVRLPLDIDGENITLHGIVDLVHVDGHSVEIIDYKTDVDRSAQSEYEKQLSVYYHVLDAVFETEEVTASIFYTREATLVEIEPISMRELRELVRQAIE